MKSTYQNKDWDSLSAAAKAEVAKVAIQKGIYSLDGIKSMYNEFAMGGDTSNTVPLGRRYWQAQRSTPTILEQKNNWVKQQKAVKDRKDKAIRKWLQTEGVKELNKEVKDYLTTSNATTWTTSNRNPKNPHLQARVTRGAKSNALWEKEHPTLNTWGNVLGAVPFAVASAPLLATAGSGIAALGDAVAATSAGQAITAGLAPLATAASTSVAGAPLYTWADVGLSSLFGGHGIQTAINEGGISPETALEIAPLGRLAKPIFNKATTAIENYNYPLGRPQVPENFLSIKPQVRTKVGDVEVNTPNMAYRQGNDLGRTYQKYKDVDASVAQHQIEDNFEQLQSAKHGKPYTNREVALDKAIAKGAFDPAVGIEVDGHPAAFQDTPMYADGYLWYGTPKINEVLGSGSLQSGLLVTPKNDAFIIGSNKATPYKGTGSGVVKSKSGITTVTDNGGRLIPADTDNLGLELNNISAYTWEPGYGYRKAKAIEAPTIEWRDATKTPEVTHFYHGSPVGFDAFSADFIGSGEGGSKVMRGINLWPTEKIANAPKFANIKSPDAPLHLGVSNTPLGGKLNPTVYDVSGKGLKLYTTTPRGVKGLSQSDLISQGYDGIQTPNQVTVFPESIGKLSIDKQSTIDKFILSHPEVERWTPWTTDNQKMQNIIDMSKMSKWTIEQWTAAQDAAIARGDMDEALRLRNLHFMTKAPTTGARYNSYTPTSLQHGTDIKNHYVFGDELSFFNTHGGYDYKYRQNVYVNVPKLRVTNPKGYEIGHDYNLLLDADKGLSDGFVDLGGSEITEAEENYLLNNMDKVFGITQEEYGKLYETLPNYKDPSEIQLLKNDYPFIKFQQSHIDKEGIGEWYPLVSELAVKNPKNIKLADAVTYDDNGVRIPLGLRDNFNINEIRWGVLPFGVGLTGYGLLNNQQALGGSIRKPTR